jgi:hypothetical protein
MGTIFYDAGPLVEIEDRTMAHLQVVIINKLRRQESFCLSFEDEDRRISVWVNPTTPLAFVYSGNRRPALNKQWIEELADTANQTGGLRVIPEPMRHPPVEAAAESLGDA